jgi:hypothetical protein
MHLTQMLKGIGCAAWCYDLSGKSRPTEFETREGTQRFLVTWKREKP